MSCVCMACVCILSHKTIAIILLNNKTLLVTPIKVNKRQECWLLSLLLQFDSSHQIPVQQGFSSLYTHQLDMKVLVNLRSCLHYIFHPLKSMPTGYRKQYFTVVLIIISLSISVLNFYMFKSHLYFCESPI